MQLSEKCGDNTLLEKNVKEFRVHSDEIINVRDTKITNLEVEAKNLGMGIKELKVQLSTKCDENTLLEKEVKKVRKFSEELISVKDETIFDLDVL